MGKRAKPMTAPIALSKHVSYSTSIKDITLFPTSDLKQQLNLPSTATEDDAWLESAVGAARSLVERSVTGGIAVRLQTKQYILNKFPSTGDGEIELPFAPLVSSSSEITISYYDGSNNSTDTTSFRVIDPGLGHKAKLYPSIGEVWPATKARQDAVTIEYQCGSTGSTTVSETIKHAIKLLVTHWYENRSAVMVGTITKELEFGLNALLNANGVGFYG